MACLRGCIITLVALVIFPTTLHLVIVIIITITTKFNLQSKGLMDWVSSGVYPLHQVGNQGNLFLLIIITTVILLIIIITIYI